MAATELSKSMNDFLTKLQDDLKEAMNTMMCTKCEGKHKYVDINQSFIDSEFGRLIGAYGTDCKLRLLYRLW